MENKQAMQIAGAATLAAIGGYIFYRSYASTSGEEKPKEETATP